MHAYTFGFCFFCAKCVAFTSHPFVAFPLPLFTSRHINLFWNRTLIKADPMYGNEVIRFLNAILFSREHKWPHRPHFAIFVVFVFTWTICHTTTIIYYFANSFTTDDLPKRI